MCGFLQNSEAECARAAFNGVRRAKNGVQLFSVRGFRHQIQQMLLHISQQLVSFIKKCLIKIANIHAHAITSVPLLAMWVRLPAGLPQAVVIHLPAHSGFQRFHAKWPVPPVCLTPAGLYGG